MLGRSPVTVPNTLQYRYLRDCCRRWWYQSFHKGRVKNDGGEKLPGHTARDACAVAAAVTGRRAAVWRSTGTGYRSIHLLPRRVCAASGELLWLHDYRGTGRRSFAVAEAGAHGVPAGVGWSCRLVLTPLIDQCPATAHRDGPRGRPCFAAEAGLQRYPKASSASRANCVLSCNFSWGTEQHLSSIQRVTDPAESSWHFSCCLYFQEIGPFLLCPAQKDQNTPISSLQ